MFGWAKKTGKKVEKGVDKAEETLNKADKALESINDVAKEVKSAMSGVKVLITLATVGMFLGISADVISIIMSGKTTKIIKLKGE